MKTIPCSKCGVLLRPYWLKAGVCNGCRNPHLIVTSVPAGSYFGPVTRTNINDEKFDGFCERCSNPIHMGEVLYTHDGTGLEFCSPSCLTAEINQRMADAEHERISEMTSGGHV